MSRRDDQLPLEENDAHPLRAKANSCLYFRQTTLIRMPSAVGRSWLATPPWSQSSKPRGTGEPTTCAGHGSTR